jgi:hypothetical protein
LDGGVACSLREVAMEGWHPVEDLIQWGFGHAPVVMANEAHSGLARSVRTREVGVRMVQAAHEAGVRRLAMEALHWPARDVPGLCDQAPPPLCGRTGVDALVVSTDNELTGDGG